MRHFIVFYTYKNGDNERIFDSIHYDGENFPGFYDTQKRINTYYGLWLDQFDVTGIIELTLEDRNNFYRY